LFKSAVISDLEVPLYTNTLA